ncbi:hypothetical protein TNCV_315971 [Trichonephila clavipes]|nr:hypothetical protein TNCV_315971 [Trichonephila clavipes]
MSLVDPALSRLYNGKQLFFPCTAGHINDYGENSGHMAREASLHPISDNIYVERLRDSLEGGVHIGHKNAGSGSIYALEDVPMGCTVTLSCSKTALKSCKVLEHECKIVVLLHGKCFLHRKRSFPAGRRRMSQGSNYVRVVR